MGTPAAIDKLVTVSKIFADQRVSELLAENRELKLKLFWKNYGVTHLKEAMQYANQTINCQCLACAVSGRMYTDSEARGFECRFKTYFDALLLECGLGSLNGDYTGGVQHMSDEGGNYVCDLDTHLVRIGRDDWVHFTYGSRLWKVKTDCDPELLKLRTLFNQLKQDTEETEEEGE